MNVDEFRKLMKQAQKDVDLIKAGVMTPAQGFQRRIFNLGNLEVHNPKKELVQGGYLDSEGNFHKDTE